jgi:hypothetical protein
LCLEKVNFQLGVTCNESFRTTAGAGKSCVAERAVQGVHFIRRGGARRGVVELEEDGSGGESFRLRWS